MPDKKQPIDETEKAIMNHPRVRTRETPNNFEAETAVLGGMLIDGQAAAKYMPLLSEQDFNTPAHQYIFAAMRALFLSARPIDIVTVSGELENKGTSGLSGGLARLTEMVDATPSVANIEYYFQTVKKCTKLRKLIEIAETAQNAAYALDPGDNALDRAEFELYRLSESDRRGKPELLDGYVKNVLKDLSDRALNPNIFRGVPTGFARLDTMLGGGFQKSDLIVLAARPGQGKTSFAMNCAVNAALRKRTEDGKPYSVAVFSLEMSAVQLAKRILCSVGSFDMSRANRGTVNADEWDRLFAAGKKLGNIKLYIDETGGITPPEILSKCRALKHSVGLDFVMIDYLQLMRSGKKTDNFVREIAEITWAIKNAAKELDIPILLLSQMSRSVEQRKDNDKESRLSDLRDSGAIEQDADIVIFIDRKPEAPDKDKQAARQYSRPSSSEVYLNVAKHRNGETGNIKLIWHPATVTFKDVNAAPDEEGYRGDTKYGGFEDSAPPPAELTDALYSRDYPPENEPAPARNDDPAEEDIDLKELGLTE